jgi:hypothetical protein
MAVQIKPETAVGPQNKRTKPVTISRFLKQREAVAKAKTGITTWAEAKNKKIGEGVQTTAPNSAARSFSAPENVKTAKSKGTKGRRWINTEGRQKPITTLNGVMTAIDLSSHRFMEPANPVSLSKVGII